MGGKGDERLQVVDECRSPWQAQRGPEWLFGDQIHTFATLLQHNCLASTVEIVRKCNTRGARNEILAAHSEICAVGEAVRGRQRRGRSALIAERAGGNDGGGRFESKTQSTGSLHAGRQKMDGRAVEGPGTVKHGASFNLAVLSNQNESVLD